MRLRYCLSYLSSGFGEPSRRKPAWILGFCLFVFTFPEQPLFKEISDEDIDTALSPLKSGNYACTTMRYFINGIEYIILDMYDNAEFLIMHNLLDLAHNYGDVFYNNKLYLD